MVNAARKIVGPVRLAPALLLLVSVLVLAGCENTVSVDEVGDIFPYIPGDLRLDSQADVDCVAGVVEISGSLYLGTSRGMGDVVESDIHDLSPLAALKRIGGSFTLNYNPDLLDLSPLNRLLEIEDFFIIATSRRRRWPCWPTLANCRARNFRSRTTTHCNP